MYREMAEQRHERRSTERDKPGFEDLYSSTRSDLVRLAHVITGSNHLAEEVVQDAFLALHLRWARIENPRGYVWQSVVNGSRKILRRRVTERRHPAEYQHLVLEPELDDTWQAIRRLPERRRTALALRYYADLSTPQIAELMGARESTVRSLIHRGLESLRQELEP
ncbi:MAG: sigma-70 family RNA polymerase sigma factor [Acidimicrobiia bacterium]